MTQPANSNKTWPLHEQELLYGLRCEGWTYGMLAELFDRSEKSIEVKLYKIGKILTTDKDFFANIPDAPRRENRAWTKVEDARLLWMSFHKIEKQKIAKKMGRTYGSVTQRCHLLLTGGVLGGSVVSVDMFGSNVKATNKTKETKKTAQKVVAQEMPSDPQLMPLIIPIVIANALVLLLAFYLM